jgi:5-methylcytosine-specific restriction protein B
MSRYNPNRDTDAIFSAAQQWIRICLIEGGSLFGERPLWQPATIEELVREFTDKPDEGESNFFEKLEGQMARASADAKCLMAEMLWALILFQSGTSPATKREHISRVWGWSGRPIDLSHYALSDASLIGIGNPGAAYNTARWRELNYLIGLAKDLQARPRHEREALLTDRDRFEEWIEKAPMEGYRQFRHIFRYLAFPDYNERITQNRDRKTILEKLAGMDRAILKSMSDREQDDALFKLREQLAVELGTKDMDFYSPPFRERWRAMDKIGKVQENLTSQDGAAEDEGEYEEGYVEGEEVTTDLREASTPPLNQILFGPPGTGKTYHAINKALEILDPALNQAHSRNSPHDRHSLKRRFDELVKEGRIRFVTFHQSFSYEDFVEGLRADLDGENGLSYRVEPGVFKVICDAARGAAQSASIVGVNENARIWKISIDGTGQSATREYCFAHDEARIGWGEVGDLKDEGLSEKPEFKQLGSNDKSTLTAFSSEMQHGDVVLCISSATTVQAIGVVTGDYRFEASVPPGVAKHMGNVLPVHWLAKNESLDLRNLNGGIRFTLKTVYELSRFTWPELSGFIEAVGVKLKGVQSVRKPLDHVLIIDEINRGNVSRIFGELITLIEPSKREGASEQLEVVLPYSKNSFRVPANVYLIGTMNTADRSLTALDIALRRRFNFVEMPARAELLSGILVEGVDIRGMLERMNERIDVLLDRDHQLGHAYFLPLKNDNTIEKLSFIFRTQILPLLLEYFFEDWQHIRWVLNDHRKSIGHQFVIASDTNVAALFGTKEELPTDSMRWKMDPAALLEIESYRGIADADVIG